MALRAVIFDMDGVLCTTTEYHYRSWKAMAQKYDIPFAQADNDKLRGLSRRRSLEVLLGGRDVTEAQAQKMMDHKNEIYLQLIEEISAANLLPGAHALLRQLKEAGVPVAVASSSQHATAVLQKLGITDYVKAVSDGNSVQKSKPAPDTFLHAAGLLGVEPAHCVAIEDAKAGVQGALAAGMCAVGIGPVERVGRAHAVFQSLLPVDLARLRTVHEAWQIATES